MRIATNLLLLAGDLRPLSSGIAELDTRYASLSAVVAGLWGCFHSFEQYSVALNNELPPYSVSVNENETYISSDFHVETLRLIRDTRLLAAQYPCHAPELKTYLHRWVFGHIMQIAGDHSTVLQAGEPAEYESRALYWFAFEKLRSAISYYDFLCQPEPYIPQDPAYQGQLPHLWRELIHKRESLLSTLLTDERAFSPADVDALLIYLGAVDKSSRTWIKPTSNRGGNQAMFPAAYAALYQKGKVKMMPSTHWASVFKMTYKAEISPSTAEKWETIDKYGQGVLNKHYKKALTWLDTPPAERKNL